MGPVEVDERDVLPRVLAVAAQQDVLVAEVAVAHPGIVHVGDGKGDGFHQRHDAAAKRVLRVQPVELLAKTGDAGFVPAQIKRGGEASVFPAVEVGDRDWRADAAAGQAHRSVKRTAGLRSVPGEVPVLHPRTARERFDRDRNLVRADRHRAIDQGVAAQRGNVLPVLQPLLHRGQLLALGRLPSPRIIGGPGISAGLERGDGHGRDDTNQREANQPRIAGLALMFPPPNN